MQHEGAAGGLVQLAFVGSWAWAAAGEQFSSATIPQLLKVDATFELQSSKPKLIPVPFVIVFILGHALVYMPY